MVFFLFAVAFQFFWWCNEGVFLFDLFWGVAGILSCAGVSQTGPTWGNARSGTASLVPLPRNIVN